MEKSKKITNMIKFIIAYVLLFCFGIIAFFMVTEKVQIYDDYIYSIVSKFITPTMTKFVKVITNFADPITVVIIALIFSYIVGIKKKDKKTAIVFCLNLVVISLLNLILKNIFARTRPEMINIITESGYSFPSGHSSISMAMYGYLIYLINIKCSNKKVKIISSVSLGILILLIGISRIYLGVHYASDVTAAFLFSLSYLIVYTHITENITESKCEKQHR